jgi:hypothetical protein
MAFINPYRKISKVSALLFLPRTFTLLLCAALITVLPTHFSSCKNIDLRFPAGPYISLSNGTIIQLAYTHSDQQIRLNEVELNAIVQIAKHSWFF